MCALLDELKPQWAEAISEDLPSLPAPADVGDSIPKIPLRLVLSCCQEMRSYIDAPIRHWYELVRRRRRRSSNDGDLSFGLEAAKQSMGPKEAAIVIVAMLERFDRIRSPGGYLRHLTGKAESGQFSPGPMIMALTKRHAA